MTHFITRRTALAGLAATSALPAFAQSAGNVVVYTSNNQQAVQAVQDTARDKAANLRFSFVTGGSGVLLKRIESEVNGAQCDIFWSSSANTLGAFKALFEPYRSPELAAIQPELHDKDNLWTATNMHVVTAMLNTNQLAGNAKPTTWTALLEPRWKGKIIIADPANSSTAYTILWGVKARYGSAALRQLAANTTVTSAAATVLRSVAQGEYAVGLTFESNAYAYVAGGQREIELIYPTDGTFTTPEYLTLIKNAPNGANARRAFDLMVSKEAQIALLEAAFRRPTRTDIDVTRHVKLPNLKDIAVFAVDEVEAAAKRAEFLAEWQGHVAATR